MVSVASSSETSLARPKSRSLAPAGGHQNIAGFQIAMENPLGMRGFQSSGDLQSRSHGVGFGHGPLEGRAFDILEHQIIRADVVNLADVRMVERRDGSGFLLETRAMVTFQPFDGDVTIQTRVSGSIDFAHAARANRRKNLIRAEFIACGKGHGGYSAQFSRSRKTSY